MTGEFVRLAAREQGPLDSTPYDRWVGLADETLTEFHRTPEGFLLRFDDIVDVAIARDSLAVSYAPVPDCDEATLERTLFNAIRPILANHSGRLSLHGSAVLLDQGAVVFLGASRRGKTTLAGALAKAECPFLTEDWVELAREDDGYRVVAKRPHLRVFGDTAAYLRDRAQEDDNGEKVELAAGPGLAFAEGSHRLRAICLLGPGTASDCTLSETDAAAALVEMMPNAFVLDSHDKPRMREHFGRLGALASAVPCYALDYPRRFDHLPQVVQFLRENLGELLMKLSDKVAISADVVAREVSGELVLLNLDSGTYFGLNPVGGRVWALVEEEPRTLQEVSAVLQEEFAVSAEEAESDLLQLAADLHQHGLLLLAA